MLRTDPVPRTESADRLTQITRGTQTVLFSYDNADRRATLTLPNGVVVSYTTMLARNLRG
jgi:YD repeat-containing protein